MPAAMPAMTKWLAAIVALACLSAGAFVAAHYPLFPTLVLCAFAAACIAAFLRSEIWLFVLPAVLPAVGLASWTGWIAFEEFDLLVLAAAAGGYAAMALRLHRAEPTEPRPPSDASSPMSGTARALIALFALSIVVGSYRGIAGAASSDFEWFSGYSDAINSLRVAKSFVFALLLYPLLPVEAARSGPRALALLSAGIATGLGVASIAVVWERIAFPGLLNFSTDYRATAMFWEMHVGGAALDGYLVLTMPFAIAQLLLRSTPARWALAGGLVLLAGYASLATFSRGIYLALPISMGLLALLLLMQRRSISAPAAAMAFVKGLVPGLVYAAAAFLVFRSGGYRALLAVLAVTALVVTLRSSVRRVPVGVWLVALVPAGIIAAVGALAAYWLPKGNYVIFAVALVTCAGILWRERHAVTQERRMVAIAAYLWVMFAAAMVAYGWGGPGALRDTGVVLLLLLALSIWSTRAIAPLWPDDFRLQCRAIVGAALVAITVAVFVGGAYMGDRFVSSERDLAGRVQHWQDGVGMLDGTADWFVGKGIGRFPQSYAFNVRDRDFPGDYRTGTRDGNAFLALFGPRRAAGFGELLRISQRIPVVPGGRYTVILDARASEAAEVHVEICEKHLLYDDGCAIGIATVDGADRQAQRKVISLDGKRLSGGSWYAPRLAFFSIAVESPGHRVEIDNVSLLGPDGGELLVNGDFTEGLRRWFFTSDRLHLPWHAKNMELAVLFDQGLLGLMSLMLLTCLALGRLTAGRARGHPLAPYLAASVVGFLVVGAFDSLLDVPRLAFLFYLVILVSLTLPAGLRANTSAS
jgi:hypothetical protein